jgi:GNAT superfamily N-acetyltransferase
MSVVLREYKSTDLPEVAQVVRDGFNTLRESRGGQHPDAELDKWLSMGDSKIVAYVLCSAQVFVAYDEDTGEIAGIGAFTDRRIDRILGSAYVKGLYVREKYQRGKGGVKVGSMLKDERIRRARERGLRKVYGFSVPESKGFHEKAGATFYPEHDFHYMNGTVRLGYYEIILRKSPLNPVRIEPYLHKAGMKLNYLKWGLRRLLHIPQLELQ